MKFLSLLILVTCIASCNIKEAKNYSKAEKTSANLKASIENDNKASTEKEVTSTKSKRSLRDIEWKKSANQSNSMKLRAEAMAKYSKDLTASFKDYSSHYTKSLIAQEIMNRLSYFDENIRNIKKVKVTRNYLNTKRGKIKDLYIQLARTFAQNDSVINFILDDKEILNRRDSLLYNLVKNIIEIKVQDALVLNNRPKDLTKMDREQLTEICTTLESANILRNKLLELGFNFKLQRTLGLKLRVLRITSEDLKQNHRLLQIRNYVDLYLD